MARPTKQGLSYFPIDTNFDEKTELFIIENGADGLGILVTVWQMIYDNEGYYIKNGHDLYLLIRKRILSDVERIEEVISSALERGIFDKGLHKKYSILTSKAIQKRYFLGSTRKKTVNVIKEYTLIDVSECNNLVNVGNNATKEEEEVDVNVKKGDYVFSDEFLLKDDLVEKYNEWLAYRREMRWSKLTQRGVNLQTKFLLEQPDPIAVIDQSIRNGWQGLFELKGQPKIQSIYTYSELLEQGKDLTKYKKHPEKDEWRLK